MEKLPSCARCSLNTEEKICRSPGGKGPDFCPTRFMREALEKAREKLSDRVIYEFARQASIQEGEGYINREVKPHVRHPVKPRLEEICDFAARMGCRRLGLAYCGGLQYEASLLQKVLEAHNFDLVSVVCKVGGTSKEEIGLTEEQKVRIGEFEPMCHPLAQAEILNQAGTDLNIIMGLCVGHDSLFIKQARAMTTVFAVKDRVLGHNPVAALYTLNSYYQRYIKKPFANNK